MHNYIVSSENSYLIIIICWHTVIWVQLFLTYTTNFFHSYTIKVFQSNTNKLYTYGFKYSYLIRIICRFQLFLSNTNNCTQLYGFEYSYLIQIIFKQIYLAHTWDPNKLSYRNKVRH